MKSQQRGDEKLEARMEDRGVNSIDIKNLGPVFGPKLGQVLPVSIRLPWPAKTPTFNLISRTNFRANLRAKIYVY